MVTFEIIGKVARTCLLFSEKNGDINVYELGFKTFFPHPHQVYIEGKRQADLCQFCTNRIKEKLGFCGMDTFCQGFVSSKDSHFFDLPSLLSHLKNHEYKISKSYDNGYICTNDKNHKVFITTL